MSDTYYDLQICRVSVGGGVDVLDGKPRLRGVAFGRRPNGRDLRDHLDNRDADESFLNLKVSDNGESGDGVIVELSFDSAPSRRPLLCLNLSYAQAKLVHRAIGCILAMRDAETPP